MLSCPQVYQHIHACIHLCTNCMNTYALCIHMCINACAYTGASTPAKHTYVCAGLYIVCTYILISDILVQSSGEGKLRGDQLPPFQLPLPPRSSPPLLICRAGLNTSKPACPGMQKGTPPMQVRVLQILAQGLHEQDIYRCGELRTIGK